MQELIAYTIMPDHVHLLVEVNESKTLSDFLRDFKKQTSKEIKRLLGLSEQHIWQRGTFDHCIRFSWTNNDFQNHLNYLFYNSWKHLQIVPKYFPYHNFHAMVERGYFDNEFYAFDERELLQNKLYE